MTVTESEEIPPRAERAAQCLERVRELLLRIRAAREVRLEGINGVAPRHRHSAVNLVDYTAVRSEDVRDLQIQLAGLGVSSLGRMESGVAEHLTAVARTLAAVAGLPDPQLPDLDPGLLPGEDLRPGPVTLARNTVRLVGQAPEGRATRIMVTMPSEAAQDPALVSRMVAAGMDVARINCAHDGPQEWSSMIEHLRAAASDLGTDVRIAMDLAGPKVRTGPVEPGPRVEKIKPERDATGHVIRPARLWLGAQHSEDVPAVAVAPEQWLAERTVGERLQLRDARDSGRTLRVVETHDDAVLVEFSKTVYFATGLVLRTRDGSEATLGELPETEQYLRVATGDTLRLLNSTEPVPVGGPSPTRIGCTLPEAFQDAAAGQRVWLDDGKIGGVIRHVHAEHMDVEITHAGPAGSKLKAEKGINFPDTDLRIPALTAKDREDLAFVVQHADIVNMSFVRSAQDVADLLAELQALGADSVDITLKIETVGGFEHLPMVLLEAMRWQDSGVMIARGDLAVETGFERMAEVQQEILWLCEAAHVPVIWATQVLETLAKKGLPSRAEITDAAQGQQAECVMLNKGPFVVEAIRTLSSVLERMSGHASKKTDLLRRLNAWEDFVR